MMKLLTAMFVALLMAGCGEDGNSESDSPESNQTSAATPPESNQTSVETPPAKTAQVAKIDLDDNETRNRIIAEAIDLFKLRARDKEGEELYYALNQQTPYTGWVKALRENGQIEVLAQFKDGKQDGLGTKWHDNGQKKSESIYKGNKQDGPSILWHSNGQKSGKYTYKDGKPDGLQTVWYKNGKKEGEGTYKDGKPITIVVWKPNGEKCPESVINGNGVEVWYNDDGTEGGRRIYKDGERVR